MILTFENDQLLKIQEKIKELQTSAFSRLEDLNEWDIKLDDAVEISQSVTSEICEAISNLFTSTNNMTYEKAIKHIDELIIKYDEQCADETDDEE